MLRRGRRCHAGRRRAPTVQGQHHASGGGAGLDRRRRGDSADSRCGSDAAFGNKPDASDRRRGHRADCRKGRLECRCASRVGRTQARGVGWKRSSATPTDIALAVDGAGNVIHTLADVGVCALDLLWEADGDDVASTSMGWRLNALGSGCGRRPEAVCDHMATSAFAAASGRQCPSSGAGAARAGRCCEPGLGFAFARGASCPRRFEPAMLPTLKTRASQAQGGHRIGVRSRLIFPTRRRCVSRSTYSWPFECACRREPMRCHSRSWRPSRMR